MLLPQSTDGKPAAKNSCVAGNREDLVDKRKAVWVYSCAGVLSAQARLMGFELWCGGIIGFHITYNRGNQGPLLSALQFHLVNTA